MSQPTPQRIQSLDRGLQILEYVSEQDQTVRLAELADLLGIEKSSAHRLAATLINRAYLKQDPDTLGYMISDRVFTLAGMEKADILQALGQARLKAYTENTVTHIDALVEECAEVVRTGVAYDREEYRPGMICIAAPIHDFRNHVIASIGLSGPVERIGNGSSPPIHFVH